MAHIDPQKLPYLQCQLQSLKNTSTSIEVQVFIITDICTDDGLDNIRNHIPPQTDKFKVTIYNKGNSELESRWLLTWVHKQIMLDYFDDPSYTHFLNIEDDMNFTRLNFEYWVRWRDVLKPFGLFPSFIRFEIDARTKELYWTDSIEGDHFAIQQLPKIQVTENYWFINLPRPYQAMFLYDRELMKEHIESTSFRLETAVPDWQNRIKHTDWPLGLTEAACFAISTQNVPNGAYSRNFLPYYPGLGLIDPCSYVHHIPNKYINAKDCKLGKAKLIGFLGTDLKTISTNRTVSEVHLSNEGKISNKWSSYLPYYDSLFRDIVGEQINLLEIGVQNGGSLETWAKYFPRAIHITGCDIDERCSRLTFSDPRISILIGNANSNELYEKIAQMGPYNIIIDDGSHLSEDIICSFVNYFSMLQPGGIYVVEDTHAIYWQMCGIERIDNSALGFFKALTDVINYQFWEKSASAQAIIQKYFSATPSSYLTDGWIDSIEFRNSIITIKKAMAPGHQKVGYMCITGNVADVDATPLHIKMAWQSVKAA